MNMLIIVLGLGALAVVVYAAYKVGTAYWRARGERLVPGNARARRRGAGCKGCSASGAARPTSLRAREVHAVARTRRLRPGLPA